MNVVMNLSEKYFELLNYELKDIEVRLLDEKRAKLKVGDTITFQNSKDIINTKILNLMVYKSFEELIDSVPTKRIGLSSTNADALKELYSIYPKDKLEGYKILAIEIKKINTP